MLFCFLGAFIGTAIGVLPGLGPAATIALLLPMTYIIGSILKAIGGLRVSEDVEVGGLDLAVHGETAYEALGARVVTEVK